MKRLILTAAAVLLPALIIISGCSTKLNYADYISENRSAIYLYKDDVADITLNCVSREQPYNADGICGDKCDLIEIFVKLTPNPEAVEISLEGYSGEMNYEAVESRFTASFSAPAFRDEGVEVTLTVNGDKKTYRLLSVLDGGVLTCEQILKCAIEHDRALFEGLTAGKEFRGEIYIRLLYDDGCYYYLGVCDRDKNITAYLLDGGIGKVIATKRISG